MAPLNIVLGCMTMGQPGADTRMTDPAKVKEMMETFKSYGHDELDTARGYSGGTSEKVLGDVAAANDFKIATKCHPRNPNFPVGDTNHQHSQEGLTQSITISLDSLKCDTLEIFWLHAPDRTVPYEETVKVLDGFYKQGKFKQWGLSNFPANEVDDIVKLCEAKGYVKPTAYQGIYNAIVRVIETELVPVLRKNHIAYYAFNPLAGGFFTDRYKQMSLDDNVEKGSRFDPDRQQGRMYRGRYWNEAYFSAIQGIVPVAEKYHLTLAEIALRWIVHHSVLKKEYGDAVIIGASSLSHLEDNLKDFEKGPLPEEVLKALDVAWEGVKEKSPAYSR